MSSRMDRYYKKNQDSYKRTSKNSDLYDNMYEAKDYDNIEKASLNVGKEIDLNDIKTLFDKRENYQEAKDYRIVKPKPTVTTEVKYYEQDDLNSHDINDMLNKAKEDNKIPDKKRSLDETQVLTLEELVKSKDYGNKTQLDEDDMKDLINTLYDTNLLKNDKGDGLLDNLKSTGDTTVSPSIKQVLDDAKKSDTGEMDKTFFTNSMGFKKNELKKLEETEEEVEDSNIGTTIFLVILGIAFAATVVYILLKFGIL